MIIDLNPVCRNCGKKITNDEIGLYKKLVNRGAEDYLCIDCLSEHFGISVEKSYDMIERFRESGCSLFSGYKK